MKNKMPKRLLSLLLVLAMLLPMAPASLFTRVQAAEDNEVVLYFNNSIGWTDVYCYVWDVYENKPLGEWPGTKMPLGEHYLNKISVPTTNGIGVIIHNGSGTQTKNLGLSDEQVMDGYGYLVEGSDPYLFNSSDPNTCWQKCRFPVENNGLVTFTYEGSATTVQIAGTMNNWTPVDMVKTGSVFSYTFQLEETRYEYKLMVDGTWVNDPLNPLKDGNSGNNYLFVDGARDAESVVVIAGSDFQGTSVSASGKQVQELLQVIQADYPAAHGFLFGGDYSKQFIGTSDTLKACVDTLKSALNSVYPGLGITNHAVYVQGNHDPDSATTDGTISTSGAHDTGAYGVYVINEKDYMWYNNDEATIKNTATALDNYLDAKYSEKYNKPIFVVSHLPLHYSMRTATAGNGDAKYANYLFDVLNEAGARGQSIIFLFGHDHSNGWDDYLGAGAVYLERGDKINIAQASTTEFEVETLNFTYMNAGYVGYYEVHNTDADGVLSMTVFEVFDDHVEINRYSKDGKYNLKSAGVTNAYKNETAYGPDKEVYSSPKSIPVNNIVTSSRDVTIAAPNVTKANVAVYTPDRPAGYSAYRSYYAEPGGYTDGDNAIITVDLSKSTSGDTTVDAFDPSRPVIITELATGVTHTVMMENGKVTFETEHFGRFTCAQVDTPAYTATAQGGGKLLQRVTDIADLQEGVPYVISEESFAKTLTNIAKGYTSSNGTVYNGLQLISDAPSGSTPYVWYYKDGHLVYGSADSNQYLSLNSGGVTLGTDVSKAVTITQNTAGNDNMYFSVVDGTTTRYVQLRGGASTNDVATVYNSFQGKIYFHFDELIDGETTLSVIPGQTALTTAQTTLMVPTVTFEGVETDALEVTWRSSDESIATVDENGKVTAIRPGNVTIYASVAQVSGAEVAIPVSVYKLDEQVSTVSDIAYVPLDRWNAINDIVETNDVGPYRISSAFSGWYLTGDYIQSTVNTNTGLGLTVEHDPADVWYYVNGNLRYGSVDGPYLVALTDGKVNIGTDASRAFNSLIPMEGVVGGYQVNNSNITGTSYTKLNQNGGPKGDTAGTWYDGTWIFEKLQSDVYELNLQVSPGNPTLRLDRTEKLDVSLLVGGVYDTDYTVIWSSSDSNVVSVTKDGRITGMSVGNATVTCRLTAVEGVALQSDLRVKIPVNVYDDSEVPGSIIASGYLTETLARNEDIQPGVSGGPYVLKDYSDGYYISGNGLVTSANGTVGLETVTENYMDHQWYYDGTHLRYGSMDGPYMAVVDGKVNLSDNVSEAFDLVARTGTYDGYVISHSSAPTRYVNRLGGGVNNALGFYSGGYHSRWYFYDVVQTPVTLKVIPETDSLYEGNSTKLISFVSVDGEDTTNYTISWVSTNPSVATVDQNGNVTAVRQGRANMVATLTAANGQQTMLQVQIPITVVRLSVDDTSSKATFHMEPLLQQVTAVPEGASGPWLIANYTTNDILTGTMDTGSTLNENGLEAKRWRNGDYTNLWFYDGERLLYGDVDAYDRMLSADNGVVYLGSDPSAAFDNLYTNTNYAETMTMSGTNFSGSYLNQKYTTTTAGRYNSVGTYSLNGDSTSFSAWKAYTLSKEHESVFYVRPPQSTIEMGSEFQLTTGLTLSGQQVTDFTVTWSSLNPEVAEVKDDGTVMAVGNGTATILATLHTVGVTEMEADITVPVTVTVSVVKSVTISSKSGTVNQDSGLNVEVGPTLTVTYADGSSKEVKMTVEHLKTGIGQFYPTTAGEYTTLKVVYEGYEVCADFNLEVVGLPDYPEYPNEGAVFVDKNAYDTVNFQNSGIAQVELEVSGIPADKGADVIIMLDTSSSMGGKLDGDDSKTRMAVLVESLNNLLTKFQTKNEDGTSKDINVAIANFQSYFNGSHHADDVDTPYYMAPEDTLRDVATPSNSDHKSYLTVYTGDQTKTVGAFASVSELGTNPFWSEYSTAEERGESRYKINKSYGTNYDYGFDVAYQLADAINTKNAAEGTDRDLYIIFMSDGHPFQYNYFHSASRVVEWNNWLSGTMTDEMFAEGSHREYYNADGKHWMAEALKGSPTKQYKVIRKNDPRDVDGDNILYINGLGATMYSIGFCMKDDNLITRESGDGLIDRIATSANHAFHTSTAEGLAHAFDQISEEIMLAVSNAYLVDTMGEKFDLQLGNPTYTVNGQQIKLNNAIEIYEYEIYTLADYETGNCSQNQLGARKPTEPKLVERVTFNDDGTEAYSNLLSGNILKNGIIHASTFFYNATDEEWGVVLDDRSVYTLAPETFYWKVGTISTNELALSYYVYLNGSVEDEINAGIYPTNEQAILYYDNYLGHESEMIAPVPVMAWNQARVGYGFYLVDKNGNPIINSQGQVGDFQLSVKLGDVVYREFNAGDDPITLKASQLINIPELSTYRLFDSDARYTVSLMENGNGEIAVTTSGLVPLTTYITGLTSTPVLTGDMNGSHQPAPGFATANTVVWFAVTEANDALIVDKTVEAVPGETNDFSLTLESYATGSAVLKPVVEPADIVLVLDQSASMYTPKGASQASYNRFDNMSSNASLRKISVSDLSTTKGKHLGYYVAQTTTVRTATDNANDYDGDGQTNDTLYMYDWFIVQYVEGTGWVYVRVAETTKSVTVDLANKVTFNPSVGQYDMTVWDGSNGAALTNMNYYQSQYGSLYDSVNEFVRDLVATGQSAGVEHRIAITGFASPYYDGIANYDGSGVYIDGDYYLYDGEYRYMGYATSANDLGLMLYVPDNLYESMKSDLPAALENITWSRSLPANAQLVRLDPNKSNSGPNITGSNGVTYKAGQYFAPNAASGSQLTFQAMTDELYANALMNVSTGNGNVNPSVLASVEAIRTNYQQTSPAAGLDMAKKIFAASGEEGRDQIVILFTDGVPTLPLSANREYGETGDAGVAERHFSGIAGAVNALNLGNDLKKSGVQLYTIGTSAIAAASGSDKKAFISVSPSNKADKVAINTLDGRSFLLYLSSDFNHLTAIHEVATVMGNNEVLSVSKLHLLQYGVLPDDSTPLDRTANTFSQTISDGDLTIAFDKVMEEVNTADVTLGADAVLQEYLSDYFDLNGDVEVLVAPYTGPDEAGEPTFGTPVSASGAGFNITLRLGRVDDHDNAQILVSGFGYSDNFLRFDRENEEYLGYKLVVKVPVTARDGFWGGNNVPTNDNRTAIYTPDGKPFVRFPMPQVNMTVKPVLTAKDQVVYYGETGLNAVQDLVNTITVGGMTVTYDAATGTFRPAADWMDDFAGMSWNTQLLNPADTTVSGTESGDYTFGVVLVPNTTGTGNNNQDNPGNIVGTAVAANGVASDEATGHVDILVPVITFRDSTIDLGDVTDQAYYESVNRESDIEWVNSDDAYGKNGLPTEPTAKFSTEPTLSFTYTPEHTAQNYMKNDTSVNVKVYRDGEEITGVSYFDWMACNAELHKAGQTVKDDVAGDTFHRHQGSTSSGEFFVHVTYILTSDAVVIDYGLNVNMNVLENDILPEGATLVAVDTADQIPDVFTQKLNSSFKTSNADEHGVMAVFTTSEGKTVLKYTPTDMQLDGEEIFVYAVKNDDATRYYYSTATVIPATAIYYEDNCDSIEYIGSAASGDYGVWKDVQQIATGSGATDLSNVFQGEDRPGTGHISNTDADQIYGYDDVYTDDDRFSMGSAKWVRVDATHDATARFTFTGTGFDIISLCNNDTGLIMVDLYAGDTIPDDTFDSDRYLETIMVDTFFGCTVKCYKYTYTYRNNKWNGVKEEITYDQIGKSTMEPENPKNGDVFVKYLTEITSSNNPSDVAYQAPVVKRTGLDYGTYTAEIYVAYSSWMEGDRHSGNYCDFYLDAIRVYDPADNGANSETVRDAYLADGEGWPVYQELRNMFITQEELSEKPTFGIVYMDGGSYNIGTYKHFGANNEVYLAKGETIGFKLDELSYMEGFVTSDFDTSADSIVDKIHLGIKGLQGKGAVTITNGNTILNLTPGTTDMYYDLTSMKNTVVTITNTGNSIISLTNVKITHTAEPVTTNESGTFGTRIFTVDEGTVQEVVALIADEGEQEPVNPTVNLQYPTLSFEDEISYNIYFDTQDMDGLSMDRFGLAAFSTKDAEGTLETADAVMNGAVQDGALLVVSTNGIPAKYLGDTMYFKVFAKLNDGTVVYSPVFGYSAQVYAKSILNSATSTQKQKSLVVAMLNYGAAAQTFFGYRTDALANANLTDEQRGLVCDYSADLMDAVVKPTAEQLGSFSATAEGFGRKYPTISFEGAFSINYYFTLDRTADAAPQLYYWTGEARENADVLTAENASGVLSMTEDGGWQAAVTDIAAKDLDDTIWVAAVYEADGVRYCSGVLSYSIGAYCISQAAVTGSAMAPFAQAAAVYGSSAKAYFG